MIHFRPGSLRTKISLLVVLASGMGLTIFAAAALTMVAHDYARILDHELLTMADVIAQNSTAALDFNDRRSANAVLHALQGDPTIIAGCLYDAHGALFSSYRRDPLSPDCAYDARGTIAYPPLSQALSRPILRDHEQIGSILLLADQTESSSGSAEPSNLCFCWPCSRWASEARRVWPCRRSSPGPFPTSPAQ